MRALWGVSEVRLANEDVSVGKARGVAANVARRAVLYPNHYCWFVLFSALDIMLTHTILEKFRDFGGRELNTFADFVIHQAGLNGAIGLKIASVVTVILVLEYVGRSRPTTGLTLANCVVAMSVVPVALALVQLGAVGFGWVGQRNAPALRVRGTAVRGVVLTLGLLGIIAVWLAARDRARSNIASAVEASRVIEPALTAEESLRLLRVQPGFRVELVAAEPLISAPVAMCFDGGGRLWVVEMRTYMPDVAGADELAKENRIVVLEDNDGDGTMDTATPFLEGLVLPRAVLPCFGGALVIEPPNILFCKDTDGDGRADERRVLLGGVGGLESPEHAPNGMIWAMDNWIAFSQHTQRFRFDGEKVTTESTPGHGQWGVTMDDSGRLYYTPNSDTLRGDLFPKQYAARNPDQHNVAGMNEKIGVDLAVWPARVSGVNRGYLPNILRPNRRLANTTAACSPTIYRGTEFPEDCWGDAFVCEPAGNLVKRLTVREYNGVPVATNTYLGGEFLTSTDERFRPVASCVGPDGALYIADMYRGVIQHRVFITPYLKEHAVRRGLEAPLGCGRIYRIVADDRGPAGRVPDRARASVPPRFSSMSDGEIVGLLSHTDGWWRDMAQQTLVQRRAVGVAGALRSVAANASDYRTRLQALWTLDGLGVSEARDAYRAMSDEHPVVRTAGLRVAEHWIGDLETLGRVAALATDPERSVRIQAALSVSLSRDSRAMGTLAAMLRSDGGDPYMRSAVISGLVDREAEMLTALSEDATWPGSRADEAVLRELVDCGLRSLSGEVRARVFDGVSADMLVNQRRAALLLDRVKAELRVGKESSRVLSLAREPRGWMDTLAGFARSESGVMSRDSARLTMRTLTGYLDWPGRPKEGLPALVRAMTKDEQSRFEQGAKLYAACVGCHGVDGRGTAAQIPPLAGSPRVLGPADRLAKILLHGLEGKVESGGVVYDGAMPAAPMRSDEELAAVMTYLRRGWGNTGEPVSAKMVGEVKAGTGERKMPWKLSELEEGIK